MWKKFLAWVLKTLQSRIGEPNLIIGEDDDPYLKRWWLIPKNNYFNIFLHHFLRDDDDRALHDHPFASLSLCLAGSYWEDTPNGSGFYTVGDFKYRPAVYQHRIRVEHLPARSAWTLFITGPETRTWGFWCPNGFVSHRQFEKQDGC